jgi:hypothetical protein
MTDEEAPALPVVPSFNAASIERAILSAQGDLFVAAQLLGHVTVLKLDRAIRADERLQQVYLTVKQVKALPEYDKASQEALEVEITRRLSIYRSDALDALHELATMPVDANSAQNQVKFAAAAKLAGGMGERESSTGIEQTLRELNESYHREAPRMKITRTQVEIIPQERAIEGSATPAD